MESKPEFVAQARRVRQKLRELFEDDKFPRNAEVTDVNPNRYPKHDDPRKGQIWGGECNRTACTDYGAIRWNYETFGLYCNSCGFGGNMPGEPPMYVVVEEKPKIECHEILQQERRTAGREIR